MVKYQFVEEEVIKKDYPGVKPYVKPKEKIKTDRELNKNALTSRIVNILTNKKDSIPIEVLRGFDLFFRVVKERDDIGLPKSKSVSRQRGNDK